MRPFPRADADRIVAMVKERPHSWFWTHGMDNWLIPRTFRSQLAGVPELIEDHYGEPVPEYIRGAYQAL